MLVLHVSTRLFDNIIDTANRPAGKRPSGPFHTKVKEK